MGANTQTKLKLIPVDATGNMRLPRKSLREIKLQDKVTLAQKKKSESLECKRYSKEVMEST